VVKRLHWLIAIGWVAASGVARAQDPTVQNGFSVKALTCGAGEHRWPSVNELGEVVWAERDPSLGNTWQVVLFRPTGSCADSPCEPGCAQQVTATAGRNHERPVIDNQGDIVFFRDGSGSGPGFEVVRRLAAGGEAVLEFSSRNQATGAQRTAGSFFGTSGDGASVSYFDFRDPLAGTNVRRLSVSGIGQLQNAGGGALDFTGSDTPDINSFNHLVYVTGGQVQWGRIAAGTNFLQPMATIASGGTFPRISDTEDFDIAGRTPPEVVFVRNARAESSRWGVITRRATPPSSDTAAWVDISDVGPSGGSEWKAVYERTTGAGSSQVYLATSPIRGPSALWEQRQAPWGQQCYGRRLGACPGLTISSRGCALTSLAMAVDAALRDFPSLHGLFTPGTLNDYMRDRSMAGVEELYTKDSGVIWPNVVASLNTLHRSTLEAGGCYELDFALEGQQWVGPFAESSDAYARLRTLLRGSASVPGTSRGGYPVIVGVKMRPTSTNLEVWNFASRPFAPGHFVLATGVAEDGRVEIADPAGGECKKRYLDEFFKPDCGGSTYSAGFQVVGRVIDPVPERRVTTTAAGAALLVTDSEGRRTGYAPAEDAVLEEIPGSHFSFTSIEDAETGTVDGYTSIIEVPEPFGEYYVELHPFGTTPHSLIVSLVDAEGLKVEDKVVGQPGLYGNAFVADASTDEITLTAADGELDDVPPTVVVGVDPQPNVYGWNNGPVAVSVLAFDANSGVSEVVYQVDGGEEIRVPGDTAVVEVSSHGLHSVRFSATDHAGNRSAPVEQSIAIDSVPPITYLNVEQQAAQVQYLFFSSDETSEDWGIGHEVNVDGAGWVPSSDILFLPNTGSHELGYRAVDLAGNREPDRFFVSHGTAGTWTSVGAPACAHWRGSVSELDGGRAILISGATTRNAFCFSEVYDPASKTWAPTGPMITQRISHASVRLASGEVLVAGGMTGPFVAGSHPPLAAAEIYNPATNTWRAAAPMNLARYFEHVMVALPDGRALVLGGWADDEYFMYPNAAAEVYDPVTDTWTEIAPLPVDRTAFNAALLTDGRVIVMGGESGFVGSSSSDIYDPVSNTWAPGPDMGSNRVDASLSVLDDGRFLLAGGYETFTDSNGFANWRLISTTLIFDPETFTFSPAAPMINSRAGHHAARLGDGRVLVIGNSIQGSPITNNPAHPTHAEIYDPVANTWQFAPLLGSGHLDSLATALSSGEVLFANTSGGGAEIFSDGSIDSTPPVIEAIADLSLEATDSSGAPWSWNPPDAFDEIDGDVPVTCTPPSGSTFPLGSTIVSCEAHDSAGNSAISEFVVFVDDTTPPTFTSIPSDQAATATNAQGVAVNYGPATAHDLVSGSVPVTCAPASGSPFPIGETAVSCTAGDAFGNTETAGFRVIVAAPPPPPLKIVRVTPSMTVLWPPNHEMVPVSLATLTEGGGPNVRCAIDGVTSSQPVRAAGDTTSPDWRILDATRVDLRAERTMANHNHDHQSDDDAGRIYTITVACTDASGTTVRATTTVTVPENAAGK
jgi:hypothetical protein